MFPLLLNTVSFAPSSDQRIQCWSLCSSNFWAQSHDAHHLSVLNTHTHTHSCCTSEPCHSSRYSFPGFTPNTSAEWENSGIVQQAKIHHTEPTEWGKSRGHEKQQIHRRRIRSLQGGRGRGHGGQRQLHQSAGVQRGADMCWEQAHRSAQRR